MKLIFSAVNLRGAHPNTVRMTVTGVTGRMLTIEAASVGGGTIEVHRLDGLNVVFTGKENTLIIHHTDAPGMIAAVTGLLAKEALNIANMQVYRRQAGADAMMVLELDGVPAPETLEAIRALTDIRSATFLKRRTC